MSEEPDFNAEDQQFIEAIVDRYFRMKCIEMSIVLNRHQTQAQMVSRAKGIYRAMQEADWAAPENHQ